MAVLYLDCASGISGDMLVAALLDAGADEAAMRRALDSLSVEGFSIEVSRVEKGGLDCCDFDVRLDAEHENHDHDMAYLHGRDEGHGCSGGHGHGEGHGHGHEHAHAGAHVHRGLADILPLIEAADMTSAAKDLARRAFEIVAQAEAKAHGVPVDRVHFHEVGAVDSIVDIVAASVLLDSLGLDGAVVPCLTDGRGTVRCQHGVIPVPVPATLNIVEAHGLPLAIGEVEGELVTPTGAALVAALSPASELPPRFRVLRTGLGAGKRAYSRPSILRALLIEEEGPLPQDTVTKLECDIDDAPPEVLAYAAERLVAAGAREVHWLPIFTKKGRPAYQLQVIVSPEDVGRMERIVFAETTTIGIRRERMERTVLDRSVEAVDTPHGVVRVKRVELPDGTVRCSPEYEDAAAIARATGSPIGHVMDSIRRAAQ